MATAIRNIPILFGKDADAFMREAEATEANPGRIIVNAYDMELTRRMMAEAGML